MKFYWNTVKFVFQNTAVLLSHYIAVLSYCNPKLYKVSWRAKGSNRIWIQALCTITIQPSVKHRVFSILPILVFLSRTTAVYTVVVLKRELPQAGRTNLWPNSHANFPFTPTHWVRILGAQRSSSLEFLSILRESWHMPRSEDSVVAFFWNRLVIWTALGVPQRGWGLCVCFCQLWKLPQLMYL